MLPLLSRCYFVYFLRLAHQFLSQLLACVVKSNSMPISHFSNKTKKNPLSIFVLFTRRCIELSRSLNCKLNKFCFKQHTSSNLSSFLHLLCFSSSSPSSCFVHKLKVLLAVGKCLKTSPRAIRWCSIRFVAITV